MSQAMRDNDAVIGKGIAMKRDNAVGWIGILLTTVIVANSNSPCLSVTVQQPAGRAFENEPEARALYKKMIDSMRRAKTLSFKGRYRMTFNDGGPESPACTYRVWMKKPNYFRVETVNGKGKKAGTLVGTGDCAYTYWPGDRPYIGGEDKAEYEKTKSNVYMKHETPLGYHSIGHLTHRACHEILVMLVDPSVFHGYTDCLDPYISAIRWLRTEMVADEMCDVIEVCMKDLNRTKILWLSRRDHLPRKAQDAGDLPVNESWSNVIVDAGIPTSRFNWSPPQGYRQWTMSKDRNRLLPPGTEAPEFELTSADGGKIGLSDYRGKVVWLYIWSTHCPACIQGVQGLPEIYTRYRERGLVILGFNCLNDKEEADEFLRKNSVNFPSIVDSSLAAQNVAFDDYKMMGVPISYIIDREGRVMDAWCSPDTDHSRAFAALKKAGLTLGEQ